MLDLLCRGNLTLCQAICLSLVKMLRDEKIFGMPMSLAVLTREKNWTNQRSFAAQDELAVWIAPKFRWRLCSAKKWRCQVVGSHQVYQEEPGWWLCLGSSAFLIVDLTVHDQCNVFRVPHPKPRSGKFAWLGNHPSLAICKGVAIEVAKARCQNCSSKRCLFIWRKMSEDLYNKGSCPRTIHNFGTASYQMPSYKLGPKWWDS